jgi:hypothetical protein
MHEGKGTEKKTNPIILAPHHGASTHRSSDKKWPEYFAPYAVIFSSSLTLDESGHHHPKCRAIVPYKDYYKSDLESAKKLFAAGFNFMFCFGEINQDLNSILSDRKRVRESDGPSVIDPVIKEEAQDLLKSLENVDTSAENYHFAPLKLRAPILATSVNGHISINLNSANITRCLTEIDKSYLKCGGRVLSLSDELTKRNAN